MRNKIHNFVLNKSLHQRAASLCQTTEFPVRTEHSPTALPSLLLLTVFVTPSNSKEQSPLWETDTSLDRKEIPIKLWDPRFHYLFHRSPKLVDILSQLHPFHFNIILPPRMFKFSNWFTSFKFPHQNSVSISPTPHTCHKLCSYFSSLLDHPKSLWRAAHIKRLRATPTA